MKNYCFATVLTKVHYEVGAGRLYQSLKYLESKYPLEILVSNTLKDEDLKFLNDHNIPYKKCDLLQFYMPFYDGGPYADTLSKFNILTLTNYDYICFLDSDIVLKENIDRIFDTIDLTKDFNLYTRLNADNYLGEIFLARPSVDTFNFLKNQFSLNRTVAADEVVLDQLYDLGFSINSLGECEPESTFNLLHLSGFIKMWELFREGDILHAWFYDYPIDEFIKFLNTFSLDIAAFRFHSSDYMAELFKDYNDLLKAVRAELLDC